MAKPVNMTTASYLMRLINKTRKVITLYIDDTSFRLLVVKGRRITNWIESPLDSGWVKDGLIIEEAAVAGKIKEAIKANGLKMKRVIAGLSGLHCLYHTITLPRLSGPVLDEAILREAESLMPALAEQLYLSWQIISVSEEEMNVFLVALPRNSADALVRTMHQAGITPYLMDLAPLALAGIADMATAIVVDVRPTEVNIVTIVDGIPQLIRSLALSGETGSRQDILPTLTGEIERTTHFYNSSHQENPLDPHLKIFIAGALAQTSEICQAMSDTLGYTVLPLQSPLESPGEFSPSLFMVNTGLALKELSAGIRTTPPMVNMNVLPEAYRPKGVSITNILTATGLSTALGLLVPLVMITQSAASDAAALQANLDNANQVLKQRLTQQQSQNKQLAELEKKVAQVKAASNPFIAERDNFISMQESAYENLKTAITAPVSDNSTSAVTLSGVSYLSSGMTVRGTSPGETEILTYVDALRDSGRFDKVIISSIEKTDENLEFSLSLLTGEQE